MAKVSGHGGFWVRQGTPNAIVHNSQWTLATEAVIDDVTDSSSGGVAVGLPIIVKVASLEMEVPEDDVAYPQALGLTEGAVLNIWLKRGALNQWDKVDGTIVRSVRVTNDQQRARRVQITCEYGILQRGVGAPS